MASCAVAELVEHAVAIHLVHLSMDVEARVAQHRDALGEELNAIDAVAENDRLVNVEL